ncbi:hypothetical protein K438DRAFT_640042 [Mycena galopus ATCC 62051]|nr:hypothetical protein K438DRAFT_640042 [Mycena galopus ATCC 62051]
MSLGLSPSSQTTRPAASAASGSVSPSAVSSSAPATIATVKKKKNLAGLIAGTVIAGLVLLGAIALFFYFVARRRGTAAATPHFGSEVDEKRPAFWPEHPIPRNLTPTAGFIYTSWEPDTWSQMAGSPRLSYTTADRLPVPPSPLAETSLPVEGKNVLYQARQEEAGRQVELLEQQIRDLTEQARPSLPSESMNASTPRQPPDSGANSQLVAQIRALRRQIDAIHNEMQISELPEYAAADPESMFIN